MAKAPTLYEAVQGFLGPLEAEYARIIDEGSPDLPVTISLGGYKHETTLATIQRLEKAYQHAFEVKLARDLKRSRGTLI